MLTIKDGYKLYMTFIDNSLLKFNTRLEEVTKDKEYLFKVINDFASIYAKGGLDITELTYGNKQNFNAHTINRYDFGENSNLLRNYILSYVNALRLEYSCITAIKQYALLKIPIEFYKFACIELNVEYSKEILRGHEMNLSQGVGNIYIREKARDFNNKTTLQAIDWKTSKDVKAQLIKDGLVPYDKETAPNGVKWHVKHTDDNSYWWWWENDVNRAKWVKTDKVDNTYFFKFVPTKFINGVARNVKDFAKVFDTVEKILATRLIGNIDKLYKIKALHPEHLLNYKATLQN